MVSVRRTCEDAAPRARGRARWRGWWQEWWSWRRGLAPRTGLARPVDRTRQEGEAMADSTPVTPAIENLLSEGRTFPPPEEFKERALVKDRTLYERAEADVEGFWADEARHLRWFRPWDKVLEWELPFAKWYVGGQLNVADNCLDRHVEAGGGDKVAYYWEGEPGDTRP